MTDHLLNTIDPVTIGARLAEARRARRLTQQQAADDLGVARTTITAMEKGERRPRAAELVQLARLYGRAVSDVVRHEPLVSPPSFLVQFRAARSRDLQPEADIQRFESLCRWYVELEDTLDAPLPRRYPLPYDVTDTPVERAAEDVASSERNRLGLGDGPLGDIWGLLADDIGLRVFALAMKERRLAGMFLFTDAYGGCIAVNANHPEERRRWSAAHEYAHFLTDRYQPDITLLPVGRRLPPGERFADAFARHFLLPATGLTRRFDAIRRAKQAPITPADLLALAHRYLVSFQAMTWRLEALALLPPGTWDRLQDVGFRPNAARARLSLPEPKPELPALPRRYETLAIQAYEAGLLSEGQLAERLATDRVGARERIHELTVQSLPVADGEWQQVPLDLTADLLALR